MINELMKMPAAMIVGFLILALCSCHSSAPAEEAYHRISGQNTRDYSGNVQEKHSESAEPSEDSATTPPPSGANR